MQSLAETLARLEVFERARFVLDVIASDDEKAIDLVLDSLDGLGEIDALAEARRRDDAEAEAALRRQLARRRARAAGE